MYFMEVQLDQEALDSAYEQINFFSNLPKHIRGMVSEFSLKQSTSEELKPALEFKEKMTAHNGKLNIPVLTETF